MAILALGAVLMLTVGCAAPVLDTRTEAKLGYGLESTRRLTSMPPPKGKIVVAVYNFRDQSGQYKFHPSGSTFSTAVTQGATAMLIQALRDSGWFIPVEREGLNNLLTERKIIRAKLDNEKDLTPLLHAPLMLEGGIIAYETNLVTGGFGAKYFGAGGSTQYRKDQVTVNLRAVDVQQGEVRQSLTTTKSILSQQVDVGVFRFVSVKRLLEIETGLSVNEPPQMCVKEAIEKAVIGLIVEGILDGTWYLENPDDMAVSIVQEYLSEREAF